MEARARIFGQPIHMILVSLPVGLLATSVVFDIIHFASSSIMMAHVAFWMISSGLVFALLAAPFGLIDWLSIPPRTRARKVGATHGLVNVAMLVVFFVSWLIRLRSPGEPGVIAFLISLIGVGLLGVSGWLGGEMVTALGVGISAHAGLNAPNTVTGKHTLDLQAESSHRAADPDRANDAA